MQALLPAIQRAGAGKSAHITYSASKQLQQDCLLWRSCSCTGGPNPLHNGFFAMPCDTGHGDKTGDVGQYVRCGLEGRIRKQGQQLVPKVIFWLHLTPALGDVAHYLLRPLMNRESGKTLGRVAMRRQHGCPNSQSPLRSREDGGQECYRQFLIVKFIHSRHQRGQILSRLVSLAIRFCAAVIVAASSIYGQGLQCFRRGQPQPTRLSQKNRIVRRGAKFAGQSFCFHEGSLDGQAGKDKPQLSCTFSKSQGICSLLAAETIAHPGTENKDHHQEPKE